jgi:hypothetical protein
MKRSLGSLVCMLTMLGAALADDAAVRKYRDYTPEQINKLSKEALKSEVPMMYTMAAQRGLSVGSELLFGMELNRLMYSGLHDLPAAIKAFQSDLGNKPSGVLTVWEIYQLKQRAEMQQLATLGFPDQFSSFITDGSAVVQGTMTIVDDKIAWPINHVRVACTRSDGLCTLSQIHLSVPDDSSWAQMYHVVESLDETYEVSRWEKDMIESHPLGTSKDCRNTSLNFNFKTKEFYFITRNAGGDCKLMLGGELEKLPKPRVAQILDGRKIMQDKFGEIQKAAYDVLSSDFRKRVEQLEAKGKAK